MVENEKEYFQELIQLMQGKKQVSSATKKKETIENLTVAGIALLRYFQHKYQDMLPITMTNASKVAGEFGFTAKNSGEKLYQAFVNCETDRIRVSRDQHRSYGEQLKRYRFVLSRLEKGAAAYLHAEKEYQAIKDK